MFQLICTILQVLVNIKKEKSQGNHKNKKKRRDFEENEFVYDSESTDIISDNDMSPLLI